jgi:hypothetical protein
MDEHADCCTASWPGEYKPVFYPAAAKRPQPWSPKNHHDYLQETLTEIQ